MTTAHPGPEINWTHKTNLLPREISYLFDRAESLGHIKLHLNKEVQDHYIPDIMAEVLHRNMSRQYLFQVSSTDHVLITCTKRGEKSILEELNGRRQNKVQPRLDELLAPSSDPRRGKSANVPFDQPLPNDHPFPNPMEGWANQEDTNE